VAFNSSGTYNQVSGAITAAAGQILQSAVWNNIHTDLGNALTALGACAVTPPSPRNLLFANGSLEIWQRGAGGSASIAVGASSTAYTADRWYLTTGANQAFTVSQQAGAIAGSRYGGQIQRNSGQTGTGTVIFGYPLDEAEVYHLRGVKPSISFAASTGANWSPTNGTLTCSLYTGTGSVTKAGAAAANYTGAITLFTLSTNIAAGTSGAVYGGIASAAAAANITQAELQFSWTPTGTAGTNDWFTLDDVMVDLSPAALQGFVTNYERRPFVQQLIECRRHFWKSFPYATAPAQNTGQGTGELTNIAGKAGALAEMIPFRNPVEMRATPGTVTLFNPAATNAQARDFTAPNDCSSTSATNLSTTAGLITAIGASGPPTTAVGNTLGVHVTVDAGI
jgi:hypothetical protein